LCALFANRNDRELQAANPWRQNHESTRNLAQIQRNTIGTPVAPVVGVKFKGARPMMKFKNLVLATALIVGGIGGISENAIASTVVVSIEDEAPVVQIATFPISESIDLTAEQATDVPFLRPAALPEPAAWDLMLLGFCSLGFVSFAGKRRSRRDSIPSFAEQLR
jgi:hypothetical protein